MAPQNLNTQLMPGVVVQIQLRLAMGRALLIWGMAVQLAQPLLTQPLQKTVTPLIQSQAV